MQKYETTGLLLFEDFGTAQRNNHSPARQELLKNNPAGDSTIDTLIELFRGQIVPNQFTQQIPFEFH